MSKKFQGGFFYLHCRSQRGGFWECRNSITTKRTITKLVALGDPPSPGIIIQLSWKRITTNENWKLCMANKFTLFSWWLFLAQVKHTYFLPKSCFSLLMATAEGGAYFWLTWADCSYGCSDDRRNGRSDSCSNDRLSTPRQSPRVYTTGKRSAQLSGL